MVSNTNNKDTAWSNIQKNNNQPNFLKGRWMFGCDERLRFSFSAKKLMFDCCFVRRRLRCSPTALLQFSSIEGSIRGRFDNYLFVIIYRQMKSKGTEIERLNWKRNRKKNALRKRVRFPKEKGSIPNAVSSVLDKKYFHGLFCTTIK